MGRGPEWGKGVRRGGESKERRSVVHDKIHSSFSLFDRGVPDVIARLLFQMIAR